MKGRLSYEESENYLVECECGCKVAFHATSFVEAVELLQDMFWEITKSDCVKLPYAKCGVCSLMFEKEQYNDFILKSTYPTHDWYDTFSYTINKTNQVYGVDYRLGSWYVSVMEYDWKTEKWSEEKEFKGSVTNIVDFFVYAWGRISQMRNYWHNDKTLDEYAKVIEKVAKIRKEQTNENIRTV